MTSGAQPETSNAKGTIRRRSHCPTSSRTSCSGPSAAAATTILQPILDAVDRHPRQVSSLIHGLVVAEDRQAKTPQFWLLWELFADRVRRAEWLAGIDGERSSGEAGISAMFLGMPWNDNIRHWRSLDGHSSHLHALFEDLPPSSVVLHSYLRFLYHVGEQSLPAAFISDAKRLRQGNFSQMTTKRNTVFLLEALLQRHVCGRPLELKREGELRDAVLFLLDVLVESGSSSAFRMRDDFVTPVSAA